MQKTVADPTKHNFHIGHATDSSGVGQHNSDAYLIFPSIMDRNAHKSGPTWYALVADGLGNDRGSYVASQLAVESTYQVLTQSAEPKMSISQRLERALQHANREVRNLSQEDRTLQGMSTTMLAAAIHNERLYLANAGNCYAYLIRKGEVQRITPNRLTARTDSDIVADAPFVGLLTQREGPILHRLLGSGDRVEIEHLQVDSQESETRRRIRIGRADDPSAKNSIVDHLPIQPGDIIVLCSGGMARATTKEEILSVASTYPPEDAAERLVRLARRRTAAGGSTAVVLKWRGTTVPLRRMRTIQHHSSSLIAAAILLIVGVWLALSLSLNVSANWAQQSQPVAPPAGQPLVNAAAPATDASGLQVAPAPGVAQPGSADASGDAGVTTSETLLTTQLPTTENSSRDQLAPAQPETSQLENQPPGNQPPGNQPKENTPGELNVAELQAISTPSNAELSVSIREHWNAFLQRSTSDGSHAATEAPPGEQTRAEPAGPVEERAPEATSIPLATATPESLPLTTESSGTGIDATAASAVDALIATQAVSETLDSAYILQPNDTLWDIANEHGITVEELLVANPQIGTKDQTLTPGMQIYIPQN